jgi:hypothetical protein
MHAFDGAAVEPFEELFRSLCSLLLQVTDEIKETPT